MKEIPTPTAIDLFCGAGGITKALKDAGFEVLCGMDLDQEVLHTYALNHSNQVIQKDISDVQPEEVLSCCKIEPGELTLLAGCPPCQGFSKQNGKRVDKDPRNLLLLEYGRLVKALKPRYIFLENVPGILPSEIFQELLDMIAVRKKRNKSRYYVSFKTVAAADYGVPQRRYRFVLVGKRSDLVEDLKEVEQLFAGPTHIDPLKWTKGSDLKKWVTVKQAIGKLPAIRAGEKSDKDELHRAGNLSELNLLRIQNTPHNGGGRVDWPPHVVSADGNTIELGLACHKKEGIGYQDVYGRMDFDFIAPTLTGGCNTITKGRFGHPTQDRPISLREAALLQTFPKEYKFEGSIQKIAQWIGNAVPVRMGNVFFKQILKDYFGEVL